MSTVEHRPRATPRAGSALAILAAVAAAGCAAPFSDFQTAHTLEPGQAEITPSYGYVQFRNDGESEKTQDEFGLQAAVGVGDRAELRAKYFAVRVGEDGDSELFNAVALGPKFALVEDQVALYAPVGFGFGGGIETSESWQVQPTLLVTLPISDQVELTPSAKAQIWLNNDADNLLAFNLGMGFGPDLRRWAIRPEVGMLLNPGEDGAFLHFGLGFSAAVGERR